MELHKNEDCQTCDKRTLQLHNLLNNSLIRTCMYLPPFYVHARFLICLRFSHPLLNLLTSE